MLKITIILSLVGNVVCGLDFSPLGTSMASIDRYGVCLISDVITNDYTGFFNINPVYDNISTFYPIKYSN